MRQRANKLLLLLLLMATAVLAQSSANYDLSRYVIGSGGGRATSASYQVEGTIGQALAGQPEVGSASYALSSGFWTVDSGLRIYLPTIIK